MSSSIFSVRWLARPVSRAFFSQSSCHMSEEHMDKQLVDKPTPFQKKKEQCIICKHNIKLDYKNPRLLSQFMSSLNGQVYGKHITGLCQKQHSVLMKEVQKSRRAMLMPIFHKDPRFNKDPPLFNPDRPQRPNPY